MPKTFLLFLALAAAALIVTCSEESPETPVPPETIDQSSVEEQVDPRPIHESFALTIEEIDQLTSTLPDSIRAQIRSRPQEFLDLLSGVLDQEAVLTVLVDKSHPLSSTYEPTDLVFLRQYSDLSLDSNDHRLRSIVLDSLRRMVAAAREDDVVLLISSTYRSYAYQDQLYRYWVDVEGQERADQISARPGYSQHQLGTTIDFGCICTEMAQQPDGIWLSKHAWQYGFSLSYPNGYSDLTGYDYEPWHFRFIGMAASSLERNYFQGVQQYLLEFLHTNRESLARAYDAQSR
jgi:D-alanyl-D-alanine carboxypeptidase